MLVVAVLRRGRGWSGGGEEHGSEHELPSNYRYCDIFAIPKAGHLIPLPTFRLAARHPNTLRACLTIRTSTDTDMGPQWIAFVCVAQQHGCPSRSSCLVIPGHPIGRGCRRSRYKQRISAAYDKPAKLDSRRTATQIWSPHLCEPAAARQIPTLSLCVLLCCPRSLLLSPQTFRSVP